MARQNHGPHAAAPPPPIPAVGIENIIASIGGDPRKGAVGELLTLARHYVSTAQPERALDYLTEILLRRADLLLPPQEAEARALLERATTKEEDSDDEHDWKRSLSVSQAAGDMEQRVRRHGGTRRHENQRDREKKKRRGGICMSGHDEGEHIPSGRTEDRPTTNDQPLEQTAALPAQTLRMAQHLLRNLKSRIHLGECEPVVTAALEALTQAQTTPEKLTIVRGALGNRQTLGYTFQVAFLALLLSKGILTSKDLEAL